MFSIAVPVSCHNLVFCSGVRASYPFLSPSKVGVTLYPLSHNLFNSKTRGVDLILEGRLGSIIVSKKLPPLSNSSPVTVIRGSSVCLKPGILDSILCTGDSIRLSATSVALAMSPTIVGTIDPRQPVSYTDTH